jgi:hypothetical protein
MVPVPVPMPEREQGPASAQRTPDAAADPSLPLRLLVGVVAAAHHGAHGGVREAHGVALALEHLEGVRVHIAAHRQVVAAGARYWPMVSMSMPCARMSRITVRISSSVSPRPTISRSWWARRVQRP